MISSNIHVKKKCYDVRNVGNPKWYVDMIFLLRRISVVEPHIEIKIRTGTSTILQICIVLRTISDISFVKTSVPARLKSVQEIRALYSCC